jgi:hypothetical protein
MAAKTAANSSCIALMMPITAMAYPLFQIKKAAPVSRFPVYRCWRTAQSG